MIFVQRRSAFSLLPSLCFTTLYACAITNAEAVVEAFPRPSVIEPSQVQQQLRIEELRPDVGGAPLITLPDEGGHNKPLRDGVNFTLKGITFDNDSVFSARDLSVDYQEYVGKSINLATLNSIAARITAHYRNAGFILSRAVVPPQHINDGIVKIRIIEGFVNKVVFDGPNSDSKLLQSYADKIRIARPLDAATLERYLLLMNDLPGVSAHAVLRPAANMPEASDVIIALYERKFDGSVTVDNRGTRYLGPIQVGATVAANNVLGAFDRTEFRGVNTPVDFNEVKFGEVVYEEQLDNEGSKAAISAGYTHTHPGYKLSDADFNGRDAVFSAFATHPFMRSRETNLFGNAEIDIRQSVLDGTNTQIYDDRLRVARVGGSYDFVDGLSAINRFDGQFSKGFDIDAKTSTQRSRPNAEPSFSKIAGDASRLQPITGPFNLFFAATGQASANTLMTAEQFSIGGANFGSAYDPSELLGDSGVAGRVELQYTRSGDFWIIPSYELYGFYDAGEVWNRGAIISNGQKSSASLTDTGIGVRFNVLPSISADAELAFPLTKNVAADGQDGKHPRGFFSVAYRF